ncbi:MAG: hypothetical protein HZB13_15115, partial [Acidobacteria bacterium]|nr:hypothetical protein [Acidobacteriota bacterium]
GTPYEFTYTATAATAAVNATDLQTQIANDATLKAVGITLSTASPAGMVFTSARGEDLRVSLSGETANRLGMGAYQFGAGSSYEYNTFTTAADATPAAGNTTRFTFGFSGGAGVDINVAWNATNNVNDGTMAAAINAALNANDTARYAGIKATVAAGAITFTADDPSTNFRLQISAAAGTEDFGGLNTGLVAFSAGTIAGADAKNYIAEGSYQLGSGGTAAPLTFSAIYSASDDQALTVQANDASGVAHSLQIGLNSGNARSLDEALNTINTALQQSNDSTLKGITAVKVISGGVEKMTLISTNKDFRLSVGANASGTGFDQSSALVSSTQVGSGSNASISTQQTAQTAVTALANAVTSLGAAQAVVGKGQNQFSFAISLASTQLTNLAASESRIRDADLALEAANLTKAQVLQQAGIAALAQANSAPQAVLSLLRG